MINETVLLWYVRAVRAPLCCRTSLEALCERGGQFLYEHMGIRQASGGVVGEAGAERLIGVQRHHPVVAQRVEHADAVVCGVLFGPRDLLRQIDDIVAGGRWRFVLMAVHCFERFLDGEMGEHRRMPRESALKQMLSRPQVALRLPPPGIG